MRNQKSHEHSFCLGHHGRFWKESDKFSWCGRPCTFAAEKPSQTQLTRNAVCRGLTPLISCKDCLDLAQGIHRDSHIQSKENSRRQLFCPAQMLEAKALERCVINPFHILFKSLLKPRICFSFWS